MSTYAEPLQLAEAYGAGPLTVAVSHMTTDAIAAALTEVATDPPAYTYASGDSGEDHSSLAITLALYRELDTRARRGDLPEGWIPAQRVPESVFLAARHLDPTEGPVHGAGHTLTTADASAINAVRNYIAQQIRRQHA